MICEHCQVDVPAHGFGCPVGQDKKTLRDEFAMAALNGFLSRSSVPQDEQGVSDVMGVRVAKAWRYADAMMVVREKK